jgi:uncharacterized protein
MRERWKAWTFALGLLTLLGVAAVALPLMLRTGPEGRIVLAVGGGDGAYLALAETYKAELKRLGVKLELRTDLMGADLIKALNDPKSGVDGGIIKGGFMGSLSGRLASTKARAKHEEETLATRSLGRLLLEPVWVFTRGDLPIASLRVLSRERKRAGAVAWCCSCFAPTA